jgi:hypothetical protein
MLTLRARFCLPLLSAIAAVVQSQKPAPCAASRELGREHSLVRPHVCHPQSGVSPRTRLRHWRRPRPTERSPACCSGAASGARSWSFRGTRTPPSTWKCAGRSAWRETATLRAQRCRSVHVASRHTVPNVLRRAQMRFLAELMLQQPDAARITVRLPRGSRAHDRGRAEARQARDNGHEPNARPL